MFTPKTEMALTRLNAFRQEFLPKVEHGREIVTLMGGPKRGIMPTDTELARLANHITDEHKRWRWIQRWHNCVRRQNLHIKRQ